MNPPITTDKIPIRVTHSAALPHASSGEKLTSLTEKLDELFARGVPCEELFGVVIPLLMQGKVRLESDHLSERIELGSSDHRQNRTEAVRIFHEYLVASGHPLPGAGPETQLAFGETQRIILPRLSK